MSYRDSDYDHRVNTIYVGGCFGTIALVIAFLLVETLLVMELWNFIARMIELPTIGFFVAGAMNLLSWLLFCTTRRRRTRS
jgi:hypothetical protein